jgi:hypothetical protein
MHFCNIDNEYRAHDLDSKATCVFQVAYATLFH